MFSSNPAKQLASAAHQAEQTIVKDIGMKAIDVGKTISVWCWYEIRWNAAKRLSTSKSQAANVMVPPEEITKKEKKL